MCGCVFVLWVGIDGEFMAVGDGWSNEACRVRNELPLSLGTFLGIRTSVVAFVGIGSSSCTLWA